MSTYGSQVKEAVLRILLDCFTDGLPQRLNVLGIEKAEVIPNHGVLEIKICGKGNPTPATFLVRVTESTNK